jgi:hypothetical protein
MSTMALLKEAQVEQHLGVSMPTLRSWRCRGIGPAYGCRSAEGHCVVLGAALVRYGHAGQYRESHPGAATART